MIKTGWNATYRYVESDVTNPLNVTATTHDIHDLLTVYFDSVRLEHGEPAQ